MNYCVGQCRLINYNKKYHSDGDCWGGYKWEGSGIIWGISVPSAQFFCEPKTALKYKGYKGSWPINQLIQLLHRWFFFALSTELFI